MAIDNMTGNVFTMNRRITEGNFSCFHGVTIRITEMGLTSDIKTKCKRKLNQMSHCNRGTLFSAFPF